MWRKSGVVQFNYCGRKNMMGYDKVGEKYMLSKTLSLNNLFMELKEKKYKFTKELSTGVLFDHIMAEVEEVRETSSGTNKIFLHNQAYPDDGLHALNFASCISKMLAKLLLVDNTVIREDDF
jgi:hypothetical protein